MSTALWVAWVLMFAALEYQGLRDPNDNAFTLTNRVRAVMRGNPALRVAARCAITVGLVWLSWHFVLVDPAAHPGA